jgi:hypothetical protein
MVAKLNNTPKGFGGTTTPCSKEKCDSMDSFPRSRPGKYREKQRGATDKCRISRHILKVRLGQNKPFLMNLCSEPN